MAVICEAGAAPGQANACPGAAAAFRPLPEQVDGFISIERFQSLTTPAKLLSRVFWSDATAVARWRQRQAHSTTRQPGRAHVFAGYRLRVAALVRDYGMHEHHRPPPDARGVHG